MGKKPSGRSIWATLVLHEFVDIDKMESQIVREIHTVMGSTVEYFIPVKTHKIATREFRVALFDGYVFIKHDGTLDFASRVCKLRGGYIKGALISNHQLSYVPGTEIDKYREQLKDHVYTCRPSIGDIVEGVEGTFTNMVGEVISVNSPMKTADVKFKTKTREIIAKNLSFIALKIRNSELGF